MRTSDKLQSRMQRSYSILIAIFVEKFAEKIFQVFAGTVAAAIAVLCVIMAVYASFLFVWCFLKVQILGFANCGLE
jgi:type IV secretory pathway VirB2 component (pilin)